MKDYTNTKCCLNCNAFCWWDGDYCCTIKMKIHQYGYYPKNGYTAWFNEDIDNTMETPDTCPKYIYDIYNKQCYIEEYKKFKEWERLCQQLHDHVTDKSGIYKRLSK